MSGIDLSRLASGTSCLVLGGVIVVGLLQLGVRLKEVQLDEAAGFSYASSRQSVRRVQVGGVRGKILDRDGRPLARNRRSFSIVCHPSVFQRRSWEKTVGEIRRAAGAAAETLGLPLSLTERRVARHVRQSLALPLVVWADVDERALAVFSEHEHLLPGFSVLESEEREYPNGSLAAHLLGYVGRDRGEAQAGDEKYNFYAPEMRGRAGVELYYDGFLRGVQGERRIVVDARGFAISERTVVEPTAGPDLRLNIDTALQREAEAQLRGLCGACVAMDPTTGDVLALASAPGFDPNSFVPTLSYEVYGRHAGDPLKPLLNRAVGGEYAPGSTFKPVTALAGLSLGYPADALYGCSGVFSFGTLQLHCTSKWGHGELDLRHALMRSCNPFFCNLALEAGTNALLAAARAFGLGSRTGIDFCIDSAGVVPDAEWKARKYGEKWFVGDLVQMGIGQGMLLASPLQMACVAGAIGTGYLVTPHLKAGLSALRRPLPFGERELKVVREGMRLVVSGDGTSRGTGWRGGEGVPVPVSGKTGTAEVGRGQRRRKNTWFIAYAPSEAPRLAVAMVIENGDSGGGTTAPRVAAVLRRFFGSGEGTR